MSLSASLHSYFAIIKKVQTTSYPTKAELITHVEKALDRYREKDGKAAKGTSTRTFERDKRDIYNLFGIDIQYSIKHKGYYVAESGIKNHFLQQITESFHILQMLQVGQDLQVFIQPEKQAKGTTHFDVILCAIKNKKQLTFTYHKFSDSEATYRTVEPYLLKEAINRWYLVAKDIGGNGYVKHFALDRISDVVISDSAFILPVNKSYDAIYQYCFGIDGSHNNEDEPQEIILSFDYHQGKYVKTLPLHYAQKILVDTGAELRISLYLYITRDLEMHILSYGQKVKVLQPRFLADRIASELKTILTHYEK